MRTEINDLLNFKFLSDLALSPNGTKAAFIVRCADKELAGYEASLYVINSKDGATIKVFNSFKPISFSWLNDESLIIGIKKDEVTEFELHTLDGNNESYFIAPFDAKIEYITNNGSIIISSNRPINKEKAMEDGRYKILDEYPFWYDGRGYISKIRNQLFLCKKGEACKLITPNNLDVVSCFYDHESNLIAYYGNIIEKIKPDTSSVFIYDIEKSSNKMLINHGELRVSHIGVLNKKVIITATSAHQSHFKCPDIISVDIDNCQQSILASPKLSINNTIVADCRLGGGNIFKTVNGKLYFVVTKDYCSQLYMMDKDNTIEKLTECEGSVDMFDVSDNKILFIGLRNMQLQEVYRLDYNEEIKLTQINKDTKYPKPIDVEYVNSEGFDVCGLLLKSTKVSNDGSYPLVLCIHGGPNGAFGHVFHHEMQMLSNEGYYVACCNPTGSDGKGDIFGDISGRWGTIDYEDIMGFVDKLLETFPEIDNKRMAVFGGSYGGYMTNWIIGHSDRFKTAISDRCISNCVSKDVTGDNAIRFGEMHMKANVYENPEYMWDRSPLKYAPFVKTPTLFIHGEADHRCHYSEALMMYTAIRTFGIDSRMVLFKGETHELCRTGKPRNRIRRLNEVKEWLEKHLEN